MKTKTAVKIIIENPGPYRTEIMTIDAFKEMCVNCNVLMKQVGIRHGWVVPKDAFIDHYLPMKGVPSIHCISFQCSNAVLQR